MVRRHLSFPRGCVAVIALTAALWSPTGAAASNTRVSISNFAWSNPRVEINLDEKVTWDWIGPDLAHSVTGISPNAIQWDSDPQTDAPSHRPGDSYTLQFQQPGIYQFRCKLHSAVRGEVVVSDVPGDPNSDPGPQAPLRLDVTKPTLGRISLRKSRFSSPKGTETSAHISERGTLDGEYYRLLPGGKRTYNGYAVWKTFIGINQFRLGARGEHFKARPGRYEVVLRATDLAANTAKPIRKTFTVVRTRRSR